MNTIDLFKAYIKGDITLDEAIANNYEFFMSDPLFSETEEENLLAFCRLLFDFGRLNKNKGLFNDAIRCFENVTRTFEHNQSVHKNILNDNQIYEHALLEQAHILNLANKDRTALLILNKLVRLYPSNLEYLNAQKNVISNYLCRWGYAFLGISMAIWAGQMIERWTRTDLLPNFCNDIALIGWIIGAVLIWILPSIVQKYINREK